MRRILIAAILVTTALAGTPARAEFVFRMGDTVYVDGKSYEWEEWKKIRDDPNRIAPQPSQPAAAASPQKVSTLPAGDGPRAASCVTAAYYSEFPSEEERFQCSGSLGALTREEILRSGWKVDLIEKIPAPAAGAAQSYRYKLVISR